VNNAIIDDCNDARKHIHAEEYKWSGQLAEIGTCREIEAKM
jgi:hypothetical protein